jgi:hypothetical protein
VAVGRPRVRLLGAGQQPTTRWACRGPQTERAVDVQPCPVLAAASCDARERVERSGVDFPGLGADDRRAGVAGRESRMQSVRAHAALLVGRYDLDVLAQPEQPAGDADGDVCVLPGQDADPRRTL